MGAPLQAPVQRTRRVLDVRHRWRVRWATHAVAGGCALAAALTWRPEPHPGSLYAAAALACAWLAPRIDSARAGRWAAALPALGAWIWTPVLGGSSAVLLGTLTCALHGRALLVLGWLAAVTLAPWTAWVAIGALVALVRWQIEALDEKAVRRADARAHARGRARELRVQAQDVASARLAKDAFLTNLSHEIRTPLSAILGYSELLADAPTRDTRAHVARIDQNGRELLALVDDLLELAKLEAGAARIHATPCSFARILGSVLSKQRPRATEKGLELDLEFTTPVPATVISDPTRLQQVINNLVTNAIKFTDAGWVRILVRASGPESDQPLVRITVSDTGVGIPESDRERIFEAFHQQDGSLTRTAGGSGIGLALAREFARRLGGDLAVRSTTGTGSSFTLTFDPGRIDAADLLVDSHQVAGSMHARPSDLSPIEGRALVVDDGADNRVLMAALLRRLGLDVDLAEDGLAGAERVLDAARVGEPFDVVLMDMQMPKLDGYAATRQLRDAGITAPIIAVTAHALPGDREKCLASGCSDYVSKPVRRHRLESTVHSLVRAARGGVSPRRHA